MKYVLLYITAILLLTLMLSGLSFVPYEAPKQRLSDYGFFNGPLHEMNPSNEVLPYVVNAPLFSDYADKKRFIYLPPGSSMQFDTTHVFGFPIGAAIIKHFFYADKPIETRIIILEEKGWKALDYVWDEALTDAYLEVAGKTIDLKYRDKAFQYIVPNLNQCKGCHEYKGKFSPIGITVKQLNNGAADSTNQLLQWESKKRIQLPLHYDLTRAPRLNANHHTDNTNPYEVPARAYLDANCSHCHNAHGPANTSGLFLNYDEIDPVRLGINKPPVAAGRGSGKRQYGIVPGKPGESILLFRMESTDPGIRMPELGRQLKHEEGIKLIRNWIAAMP